jgi:hypothetical protein
MFNLAIPTEREIDLDKLRLEYVEALLSNMDYKDLLETFRSTMFEHLKTLSEDELYEEIEKWGFGYIFDQQEIIEC